MKVLILTILFGLFSLNVFSQQDTPLPLPSPLPPPPRVYTAPDRFDSRTKTFESKEGAFKVYLPTKPEKRINEIQHTFGKGDFVIYTSTTQLSIFGVTYFDTPTVLTDNYVKNLNYERQRDALLQGINGKLLRENEFVFGDYAGKEFVIFGNNSVITMRTFFVQQRMYRNLAMFPAATEKNALAKLKTTQPLTKKFFESFVVTELPAPKSNVVELPEDFAVSIENDTFYSGFFDFSIEIPEGYKVFDKEEAELVKELGLAMSENSTLKGKEHLKTSYDRTAVLLIAMKDAESEQSSPLVLTIAAEATSFPVFSPKSMGEIFLKELIEENEVITKNVQEELIGGVQFAWVETLDKNDNSRHRLYIANLKGLAFQISYIYQTEEDLNDFLKLLKTISFRNQNNDDIY